MILWLLIFLKAKSPRKKKKKAGKIKYFLRGLIFTFQYVHGELGITIWLSLPRNLSPRGHSDGYQSFHVHTVFQWWLCSDNQRTNPKNSHSFHDGAFFLKLLLLLSDVQLHISTALCGFNLSTSFFGLKIYYGWILP